MMASSQGGWMEPRPQAAGLIQAAVLAVLVTLSTCMTGSHTCPRSLDCARAGRYFCQPGQSVCGPCLPPLVENSHGRCVVKRRHSARVGKVASFPELDDEIDFLSAIISQQQETDIQLKAPPAQEVSKTTKEEPRPQSATHRPTAELPATLGAPSAPPNDTASPVTTSQAPSDRGGPDIAPITAPFISDEHVFLIMTSVFIAVGSLALIIAGVFWIRLKKGVRLAQKVDYPAYGGMGPQSYDNNVPGDKKLAHSAQMYHYQHQKQQMLSLGKHRDEPKVLDSGATSDEENEDGDFTVYECPGLAPTGEMEVKNPLFDDSPLYFQRTHK